MARGQGLPITTIIIAALGIIVLVVVGAIFSGQIGKFGRAASECPGTCYISSPSPAAQQAQGTGVQFKVGQACDEFEVRATGGSYIARGSPLNANPADFRCTACCVPTG